jgi:hypothetical protein
LGSIDSTTSNSPNFYKLMSLKADFIIRTPFITR